MWDISVPCAKWHHAECVFPYLAFLTLQSFLGLAPSHLVPVSFIIFSGWEISLGAAIRKCFLIDIIIRSPKQGTFGGVKTLAVEGHMPGGSCWKWGRVVSKTEGKRRQSWTPKKWNICKNTRMWSHCCEQCAREMVAKCQWGHQMLTVATSHGL